MSNDRSAGIAVEIRRKHALLAALFTALLLLHTWLLLRSLERGDALLATLLAVALAVFLHRVGHHALTAVRGLPPKETLEPAAERRHVRTWSLVLLALLPVHAWLLAGFVAAGDTLLSALLLVALATILYRLVCYARRARSLRRVLPSSGETF